jgi:hypothetical protein
MTDIDTRALDRELKKGSAELLILSLLDARSRHGYELSKLIQTRSGGKLTFHIDSLYPLLYRLEERGWIKGAWVERPSERRVRHRTRRLDDARCGHRCARRSCRSGIVPARASWRTHSASDCVARGIAASTAFETTDNAAVMAAVRKTIQRVDPGLPILSATSIEERRKDSRSRPVAGSEFELEADLVLLAMGFVGPERHRAARPARRPHDGSRNRLARQRLDDERRRRVHYRRHAARPVAHRLGDRRRPRLRTQRRYLMRGAS